MTTTPPKGSPIFVADADLTWTDLGGGVKRKVLCYDATLMLVRVVFEAGAVGAPHRHPHIQSTIVARGRFEVRIGEAVQILGPGDSFIAPTEVVHSVVALEAGELIDSFAPMRDEFV